MLDHLHLNLFTPKLEGLVYINFISLYFRKMMKLNMPPLDFKIIGYTCEKDKHLHRVIFEALVYLEYLFMNI